MNGLGGRPGPPARRRARPERRAARRALPVEPADAARAPLGLRRAAADEPAHASSRAAAPRGPRSPTRRSSSPWRRATSASATRSRSTATSSPRRARRSRPRGPSCTSTRTRAAAALALPARRDRPRARQPVDARRPARRRGRGAPERGDDRRPSACSASSRARLARSARAASPARCWPPPRRRASRPPAGCCPCERRPAPCLPDGRLQDACSARSRARSRTARWPSGRWPRRASRAGRNGWVNGCYCEG